MAYVLPIEKQATVIGALAEGSSIRSIERMTGVHRDTIMRLGVRVGEACEEFMDKTLQNLPCKRLEIDEIWGFIEKKQKHVTDTDDASRVGDAWTFIAVDAETKLVPCFRVGKRDAETANAFVGDLANRMTNRVQLSADALKAYLEAVELGFGGDVDFAQIVKTYSATPNTPESRYSPPAFVSVSKTLVCGDPDMGLASTSYVERQNLTLRMHCRRLTRLTNAFSKKLENFKAAVALSFAYYNFCLIHRTLRATPAMACGVERSPWTVANLVELAQ